MHCLSHEGGGIAGQRQILSYKCSGDTRQRRCLSHNKWLRYEAKGSASATKCSVNSLSRGRHKAKAVS